jgi:ribulose-phosphate 3-epimerase
MRIAASLASSPLHLLIHTVRELEAAGVDMLHFDIEDGSFVPCMNLGTRIIAELRPVSHLPFDVHLMMVNPEWLLPELKRIGADRVSVHYEACPYPRRVLRLITDLGMIAGLAFNPATPIPDLRYLLPHISFMLILTTEPEIPDAPYLPAMVEKLRTAKAAWGDGQMEWMVDGGIQPSNVTPLIQAGADTLAAGRFLFLDGHYKQNVRSLRAAA